MRFFRKQPERDLVIDLREPATTPSAPPLWGSPVPCPECSGRGYLDQIDAFNEIEYLHCTECGAAYHFTKAELERVVA